MAQSFLGRLFGSAAPPSGVDTLYQAVIARGRSPDWYLHGGVADTMDGRFDMIGAVLSVVLIRMETLGDEAKLPMSLLTEAFITDMDAQLREIGIGDVGLGKHVGKMMSALGGRLGAYRDALTGDGDLRAALLRNLYRDEPPGDAAVDWLISDYRALHASVATRSLGDLLAGQL